MYFEIYQETAGLLAPRGLGINVGQWRWRLKAANHEIVASGESYTTHQNCLAAINLVKGTNNASPVVAR